MTALSFGIILSRVVCFFATYSLVPADENCKRIKKKDAREGRRLPLLDLQGTSLFREDMAVVQIRLISTKQKEALTQAIVNHNGYGEKAR